MLPSSRAILGGRQRLSQASRPPPPPPDAVPRLFFSAQIDHLPTSGSRPGCTLPVISPALGTMNRKMAPWGMRGEAHIRPPWASMIDRQIERPMPFFGLRREQGIEDALGDGRIEVRGPYPRPSRAARRLPEGSEETDRTLGRSAVARMDSWPSTTRFSKTRWNRTRSPWTDRLPVWRLLSSVMPCGPHPASGEGQHLSDDLVHIDVGQLQPRPPGKRHEPADDTPGTHGGALDPHQALRRPP